MIPGAHPTNSGCDKTRRKPLKTDRLLVFQFGAKMPLFSAGNLLAENGNSLGHLILMPPPAFTGRGLRCKHLSKKQAQYVRQPTGAVAG